MDLDCDTNYLKLLAPIDWEYQTQPPIVDDDIDRANYSDEEEDEEVYEKWLMWLNSDIFWNVPEKPEIMLEIFSRIPPKSLLMLKCMSKNFLDFTKQNYFLSKQFDNTRDAVTGFFGQQSCGRDNFVYPDDFGGIQYINLKSNFYSLQDPMLNFVLRGNSGDMVRLIDSCNGLLLCINIKTNPTFICTNIGNEFFPKREKKSKPVKTCFVCNPFTKEKVALPNYHRQSTRVNHALMADLDGKGYLKYKVVCLLRDKILDTGTELLIFSSETGEWEEIKADLPPMHYPTMMGSKVFFKGSLFWDCFETHILVCHLDKKRSGRCFELIEAPHVYLGRCLWKFHEKLLCYCHSYKGDFPTWSLSRNEFGVLKWEPEGSEMFETMSKDISRMTMENLLISPKVKNPPQVRFKIIAHDPMLDVVYFWLNDLLFYYRLWNREVCLMRGFDNYCFYCHRLPNWRWKFQSNTCVVAYRHSLARIQTAKKGKEEEEIEREGESTEKICDWLESIVEKTDNELVSMYEDWANKVKPKRRKGKIVLKHQGFGSESDEEESVDFPESIKKNSDELVSCLCVDIANKVRRRHGKPKRSNFSLLRPEEE